MPKKYKNYIKIVFCGEKVKRKAHFQNYEIFLINCFPLLKSHLKRQRNEQWLILKLDVSGLNHKKLRVNIFYRLGDLRCEVKLK